MGRELTPNRIAPFTSRGCPLVVLCGISTCFQVLSPCLGQIAHALLTRPPLEHSLPFRRTSTYVPARLACVKHAASVRPEPGSNSDVQSLLVPSLRASDSPKPSTPPGCSKRLLSQKSDCSFFLIYSSLYRFQGSICCRCRDNVEHYSNILEFCQAFLATLSENNTFPCFFVTL